MSKVFDPTRSDRQTPLQKRTLFKGYFSLQLGNYKYRLVAFDRSIQGLKALERACEVPEQVK